jgi:hypothetical protein
VKVIPIAVNLTFEARSKLVGSLCRLQRNGIGDDKAVDNSGCR